MSEPSAIRRVRFGVFELDIQTGELRRSGVWLRLQEQPFQILRELVLEPGRLVTRERLQEKLWPDGTFVDFDHRLNAGVQKLRDLLGDSCRSPRFIETLPKKGYRFIAPIEVIREQEEAEPPKAEGRDRRWALALAVAAAGASLALLAAWRLWPPSELNPDRWTETTLTRYPGAEIHPSFSPDASHIAYSARRGAGPWNIYAEVVDSGRPRQLSSRTQPRTTWRPSIPRTAGRSPSCGWDSSPQTTR
jgi:DNA-binding winged helix-turn-helix (wHTH) protein